MDIYLIWALGMEKRTLGTPIKLRQEIGFIAAVSEAEAVEAAKRMKDEGFPYQPGAALPNVIRSCGAILVDKGKMQRLLDGAEAFGPKFNIDVDDEKVH